MGVSRKKVKRACISACKNISLSDIKKSGDTIRKALNVTVDYFEKVINPVHKLELPYMIAVLDVTLRHLREIDCVAANVADGSRIAFDMGCGHISSGVLEEAIRAMFGEVEDEKE